MTGHPPPDAPLVIGMGEILWDLLPAGRLLGGAPANFAYHARALGNRAAVLSRVGADDLGSEILERVSALGLPNDLIQVDKSLATGTVDVEISADGQPRYTIVENVAWDRMRMDKSWTDVAEKTAAVCFGSLAQRDPVSRETIRAFLRACPPSSVAIFDINLRQHFHSPEIITEGLRLARIAKLNDEELPKVAEMLGLGTGGELELSGRLLNKFVLDLVCLTRGARGSLLTARDKWNEHPGYRIKVADTIGSGDAFVAAVAHHYLRQSPLVRINEAANRLGAFVASRTGATPEIPDDVLESVR